MNTNQSEVPAVRAKGRTKWIVVACVAIAAFLLLISQRADPSVLLQYLPFLILLLCPLMHVFMHGGHGSRHKHDHSRVKGNNSVSTAAQNEP